MGLPRAGAAAGWISRRRRRRRFPVGRRRRASISPWRLRGTISPLRSTATRLPASPWRSNSCATVIWLASDSAAPFIVSRRPLPGSTRGDFMGEVYPCGPPCPARSAIRFSGPESDRIGGHGGCSSMAERQTSQAAYEGSIPFTRSIQNAAPRASAPWAFTSSAACRRFLAGSHIPRRPLIRSGRSMPGSIRDCRPRSATYRQQLSALRCLFCGGTGLPILGTRFSPANHACSTSLRRRSAVAARRRLRDGTRQAVRHPCRAEMRIASGRARGGTQRVARTERKPRRGGRCVLGAAGGHPGSNPAETAAAGKAQARSAGQGGGRSARTPSAD